MAESIEERILARNWFYRFRLPSGAVTPCSSPPNVLPIHGTRKTMMESVLDPLIGKQWPQTTCLDIACHEGFFSLALARKGAKSVLGIDAREENIQGAQLIRDVFQQGNLSFRKQNIFDVEPIKFGTFDVVLVFGLLYHLENPVQALRTARQLTRRVCLVETQVAPGLSPGPIDWGNRAYKQMMKGSFVLVEETDSNTNRQANLGTVSLVPNTEALVWLMAHLGFDHVELVPCPEGGYEQFECGSRVVVAGYVGQSALVS